MLAGIQMTPLVWTPVCSVLSDLAVSWPHVSVSIAHDIRPRLSSAHTVLPCLDTRTPARTRVHTAHTCRAQLLTRVAFMGSNSAS